MTSKHKTASASGVAQIQVKLVQESNAEIEDSLQRVFLAAIDEASMEEPSAIAALATRLLGAGCSVTLEAERGGWSRYRVAVRVQGLPVTIATVEINA